MREGFAMWANPSSPHAEGRKARAALEDARARIKAALGWDGELIFTSGASEALEIAIRRSKAPLTQISGGEHEAVLRHAGDALEWGLAEHTGLLGSRWRDRPGLVAIQHANNEIGVIQDIDRWSREIREEGGVVLCDCAQTAGKLKLPDADLIAISAHKFGGPIGTGALLVRDFRLLEPSGGQERGYRGGTENLPDVLGMMAALELGNQWMGEAQRLRLLLDAGIQGAGGKIVAAKTPRIPTIAAYCMPGISSAAQLIRFDAAGFAVSAGSACSSGTLKPSHTLRSMWYSDAGEVIRVSLGRETTEVEIDAFLGAWRAIAETAQAA